MNKALPILFNGFNTQPPEGGCKEDIVGMGLVNVSTHSRPKAAAYYDHYFSTKQKRFNTQPPEGGCLKGLKEAYLFYKFQHTAARRRLLMLTPYSNPLP